MRHLAFVPFLLVGAFAVACGGKDTPTVPAAKGAPPPASARAAALAPSSSAALGPPPMPPVDYGENEFTESDHSRDPFRSYANLFVEDKSKPHARQVEIVLGQYSIDELRLVAIVQSGDYPRAMLVDPTTKGWVVKRGDYIGRPDTVHTGGTNGADYQLNWRVDRIRDGDVVLTREDPAQPGVPPATRVLPLHSESDQQGDRTN